MGSPGTCLPPERQIKQVEVATFDEACLVEARLALVFKPEPEPMECEGVFSFVAAEGRIDER